ncbi:probable Probable zinc metalloprotease ZYRO0G12540g [Zygosaccharomyces bailii]|uniref:Peptide hydrolase n=1 Tax=Zygosaccharomyces bailii (strain CLIB 213 / ATCC 58445 / CBS 680 / BCRC 21525 / NBRC 1098 / NCYC 1416 / NRRL Y-2227) TaxID=1333698 RepID=A0A8J2TAZ8_ZYGB2|nr:ZYBA0S12-02256g1_1 [Zygosaccharomyces bailii CLIB 213]SJM86417.1 probable Probable zinc metalloprotease ZYRO0G12540g [Zygosaccharomyces bailii]
MFAEFLRSLLRFRKTTVSVLLLLTYSIIGLIYVFDHQHYKHILPEESSFKEAPRLVDAAWLDLQNITHTYHPYVSHDNVRVHDYLLSRITNIAQSSSFISVSDDAAEQRPLILENPLNANGVLYFESANILVKIQGKDSKLPGLLLSAHFDSVPTGYGATDDGKGVVSLLGILDYYSQNQPERTLVFNFNDNEEFGLLGAEAFFNHPWSELVHYMINLEGTGIGGKAVLFRTSDVSTARIYQKAVKVAPFGNSMYQQGFYERRVNSETDYKVYEKNGLRGFDIAFYKPRDLYHTRKDSVQYTSKEALWHMFHTAWQLADYFAEGTIENRDDRAPAIYFDMAGRYFFVTSAKSLFKWCCAILITFPLLHFLLDFIAMGQHKRTKNNWMITFRLPLSFAISLLVVRLTQKLLTSSNPFVISRGYLIPLLAISAEFLISNYAILSFFEYLSPTKDFKTTAFRQIAVLTWASLLFVTIMLYDTDYEYTGIYWLVILYPLCATASALGYFGKLFRKKAIKENSSSFHTYTSNNTDEEQQTSNIEQTTESSEATLDHPTDATRENNGTPSRLDERAPLLISSTSTGATHQTTNVTNGVMSKILNYDWSLQFLIAVPISTFFIFNSVDLGLDALNQTIQESETANKYVWNIVTLGGVLLVLPVLPFAYKLNYCTAIIFLLVCVSFLNFTFLESPFTEDRPLKVRFIQQINLTNNTDAVASVYGRKGGFLQPMLLDMPSVKQNSEAVWCNNELNGMEKCSYVGYSPHPIDYSGSFDVGDLMSIDVLSNNRNSSGRSSYAPIEAELRINAKENRICSLWFGNDPVDDQRQVVRQLTIYQGKNNTHSIKSRSGFVELQLHKLDFEQTYFRVGLQWLPKILLSHARDDDDDDDDDDHLDVSVTCYWGEYDSESIVDGKHMRKLPAFDELLQYAPLNVSFANREKGLLTVSTKVRL